MNNIKLLKTSTLLLARQWLLFQSNSTKIDSKFAKLAIKRIDDVDKELWYRLISNDTPWGECEKPITFEDNNIEETLKNIFRKESENVDE